MRFDKQHNKWVNEYWWDYIWFRAQIENYVPILVKPLERIADRMEQCADRLADKLLGRRDG